MTPIFGIVEATERLAPRMVRIVFGGNGLDGFVSSGFADEYVNALFVPDSARWSVPFDVDRARSGPLDEQPRGRRYTVRAWDPVARRLTIDFVVHGDVGRAGRWAQHAQIGDRLQVVGPSGSYTPDADADWHLLVGDESALPAIGAALERLDPGADAIVVALVDEAGHEIDLPSPATVAVRWIYRHGVVDDVDVLARAVAGTTVPNGRCHAFVHGEAAEVRAVRRHLVADRDLVPSEHSISPYWRRDHTDEQWRRIKQQWLSEQDGDTRSDPTPTIGSS
jgi:NADPH-dependent ferric siderophore reductase